MTTYATDSQGKFIPATQRPDGTWRKPRRVKDGYIPQEEVPLYESKGKLFAQKPKLPPGFCPEAVHKTKEKRDKHKSQPDSSTTKQNVQKNSQPGLILLDNKSQSVKNKKKKQPEMPEILLPSSSSSSAASSTNTKTKDNANVDKLIQDVSEISLSSSSDATSQDVNKKLRKLKKKIREIEVIEERIKLKQEPKPDKDQLDKVKRKAEILKEIEDLEMSLACPP